MDSHSGNSNEEKISGDDAVGATVLRLIKVGVRGRAKGVGIAGPGGRGCVLIRQCGSTGSLA